MSTPVRVLFVCLGNICRSPMAEGLFRHLVAGRGLDRRYEIDSAGTGDWHLGETAHPATLALLRARGIEYAGRSRLVADADFARFDWLLAMDSANLADLRRLCPAAHQGKLHRVLSIAGGGDVPDPYGGGAQDYERVAQLLQPALVAWLDRFEA